MNIFFNELKPYYNIIDIRDSYSYDLGHAYNAINMDGGSSTTMVIGNKLINDPCEPQKNGQDFISNRSNNNCYWSENDI